MTDLFDTTEAIQRTLSSPAACRNAIGHIGEMFAARVLKLDLLPINGSQAICPDFRDGEIKTVGRNKRGLIYKWRLEKDLAHHDPASFFFVFVHHTCGIECGNASEIAKRFAERPPRLLIASLREVADVLQVRPVQIFKMHLAADGTVDRRVGYNRTGYADGGWTFPTNLFKPAVKRWQLVTWAGSSMMTEIAGTSGAQHSRFLFDADP